ncbi:VC0807 family protein [Streptomyces sp. I05A-00742]|uniref:VC0807 family protein n=1 Tax=Streptomyces sp. I05A-00742 TaxID=2732853 RepID=UPI001488F6AE|nr:VC0807 family protein [Streptomyces sp. I05A-00742]
MRPHGSRARRDLVLTPTVVIALPLALYYLLRAQGAPAWQALLISSAPPVVRALAGAVRGRRVGYVDALVVGLLLVSAAISLISGNPRVLLLKDAALPAAVGVGIGATLWSSRPFAFRFGRHLGTDAAAVRAERYWRESPDFRRALRSLTVLWAGAEFLDALLSAAQALILPVDAVPLLGRAQSLIIVGSVVFLSVRRSWRFRERHGIPLFGLREPDAAVGAEARGKTPDPV